MNFLNSFYNVYGSIYLLRPSAEVEGHRMGGLLRPRQLIHLATVALWASHVWLECVCMYVCDCMCLLIAALT